MTILRDIVANIEPGDVVDVVQRIYEPCSSIEPPEANKDERAAHASADSIFRHEETDLVFSRDSHFQYQGFRSKLFSERPRHSRRVRQPSLRD